MLRACARVRAPVILCTRTSHSSIALRPVHRSISCLRPSLPSSRVRASLLLFKSSRPLAALAAPSSLPHAPRRAHVVLHPNARVSENDWSYQRRDYSPRRWGGFGRLPSEDRLMWLLIIANVLIALLWWILGQTPKGRKFMIDNFTVSPRNVRQGRVWTILTSA